MARHTYTLTSLLRPAPQRRPLLSAGSSWPLGPVTVALRTMRAADPEFDQTAELRALRQTIADRIEADIALLDALDGDPDLEPYLASPETLSWQGQEDWARGGDDDRENANCEDCDGEPVRHEPFRIVRVA